MTFSPPEYPHGFVVNGRTIANIVGILAIIGAIFAFMKQINDYENRLNKIEFSDSLRNDEVKSLTTELKSLNSKLNDLTTEIKVMTANQKNSKCPPNITPTNESK